MMQRTNNKILT